MSCLIFSQRVFKEIFVSFVTLVKFCFTENSVHKLHHNFTPQNYIHRNIVNQILSLKSKSYINDFTLDNFNVKSASLAGSVVLCK